MKKLFYAALLPLAALLASCDKKSTTTTPAATPHRWVKVYNDVIIANDAYAAQGQYFNPKTGSVVKLVNADSSVRNQLALLCYISSGGDYVYLTAPGSIAGALGSANSRPFFTHNPNGINNWSPLQLNSSELRPVAGGMTVADFDALAVSPTWDAFNNAYKANNAGNADLAFTLSYDFADNGDIFLVQINDALRMIFKAESVNADPVNGYIRADIMVEGRDDMPAGGLALMPAE